MTDDERAEALDVRRNMGRLQSLVLAAAAAAEHVLGTCEAAIDRAYAPNDGDDDGGNHSGGGSNGQPGGLGVLTRGPASTPPLLTGAQ